MSSFPVSLEKEDQLAHRMAALGVRESDIEETFVRSGGHGGQNVNKTATCVMLLHRPTSLALLMCATRRILMTSNGEGSQLPEPARVY